MLNQDDLKYFYKDEYIFKNKYYFFGFITLFIINIIKYYI